jgi:peptide/nickel transport system substrate-binding protein
MPPGYDPDVPKNRAEARQIMEKLGYGPDNRLAVTVSTRNTPPYRDPAVILIDQLNGHAADARVWRDTRRSPHQCPSGARSLA